MCAPERDEVTVCWKKLCTIYSRI